MDSIVENPKFVRIDSEKLKEKIEALKAEKEKIDEVFDNFGTDVNGINNYWSGTSSDEITDKLKTYASNFEKISEQLNSYIEFLEQVSNTYEAFDKYIDNQVGNYS